MSPQCTRTGTAALLATVFALLAAPASGTVAPDQGSVPDSVALLRAAQRDVRIHIQRVQRSLRGAESTVLVRPPSFGLMSPEASRRIYLEEATRRRPQVIAALDEYARRIPGDDWIVGWRVALRIMQGDVGEAVDIGRACEGSRWWCEGLLGWALHVAGRNAEAEAAIDASLAAMPGDERCDWADELMLVLQGGVRDDYGSASCDERPALADRLWWLADPLHVQIGNERKVEHFVRLLAMRYHHEEYVARTGCMPAHHAEMIQGGWPPWWFALPSTLDPVLPGQAFLPTGEVWTDPLRSGTGDWDLSVRRVGERYMLFHGLMAPLAQQTAFFLRGDSVLVASSLGLRDRMLVAGVALSTSELQPPLTVLEHDTEGPVRVEAMVPRGRYLVSVEAIARGGGSYRARFGHGLPEPGESGLQMSDLLMFEWQDGRDLEHTYEAVLPHMLSTQHVAYSRVIGLYWETYGLPEEASVDVRVQLQRTGRGFLRRLGEDLRLVGPDAPVSVRWTVPDDGVQVGRHLRLDLGSQEPGQYELLLEVRDGEGRSASATRMIEIVGG